MTQTHHDRPGVSRRVVATAIAGTVLLGLGAAVLSFTALTDLAIRAGVPHALGFVWPVIVDGLIVVSTIAVFAASGPSQRGVRTYAWSLLGLGAAVSVLANGAHALVAAPQETPRVMAVAVASVPPIVLLAVTHLTALLARKQHPETSTRASVPASVELERAVAVPSTPTPPTEPEPEPEPEPDPDRQPIPEQQPQTPGESDWLDAARTLPAPAGERELVPAGASTSSATTDVFDQVLLEREGSSATTVPSTTLQATASPVEPVPAPVMPRSEPGDLNEWIAERVRAGKPVSGKAAFEAGLVGSLRTGTRRIAALREEDPDLFNPRVLRALSAQRGA